jgi:hypothetical protein
MMDGSITGHVLDTVTGGALSTLQLHLYRHGVLGETLTAADELGRFAFRGLPSGRYSLGVYDARYAPLYRNLSLEEGESIENLELRLTLGAFIKGQILDEEGDPPQRCHFTLIRAGDRRGRTGYISDSGDHQVDKDGRFLSPPLYPGRYFLRFSGILKKPSGSTPPSAHSAMQQRIFDFLYPNAQDVSAAAPFDVRTGEIMTDLELGIPRPIGYSVRGKLTGALPENLEHLYVHFTRDVGMLDEFGSLGVKVDSSGAFEGPAQPGRYRLSVWEMAPPREDGYTRMTKEFSSTEVTVGTHDVDGLEIQIDPATSRLSRDPSREKGGGSSIGEEPFRSPSGSLIRCPKCGVSPDAEALWSCRCGHRWNTFHTRGLCPACHYQWEVTMCQQCGAWSPHEDWHLPD